MNRKPGIYILFLAAVVFVLATGCKKEKFLNTGGELNFSVDTLMFDTVFASLGSYTASVKIYNPQNQKVNISKVYLENKDGKTPFIINVNGHSGDAENIEIAAKDSIYVFATVNIDPTSDNNPFVVEDNLVATLNGKNYSIPFMAYGQNAYYIVDSTITGNNTWKTDKPYVIIHNAAVDTNSTLTIPAGCRIYVHADSRIYVLGTLKVKGTKQDSVVFQGDRLDRKYFGNEGYPGEWGGIYFNVTSTNNEIEYAILKNVGNSTRLGTSTLSPAAIQLSPDTINDNAFQLVMKNTVIENSIGYGILALGSTLYASNCLINTCGAQCFAGAQGGQYNLDNCTFATYGTAKVSHVDVPVMTLLNYFQVSNTEYYVGPLVCELNNCVVYGSLETEFEADYRGDTTKADSKFSVRLNNCLVKNKDGIPSGIIATNTKVNEDPKFKDYNMLDFHPSDGSPLIGAGKPINGITTDLDGKSRDPQQPDIGCYEF